MQALLMLALNRDGRPFRKGLVGMDPGDEVGLEQQGLPPETAQLPKDRCRDLSQERPLFRSARPVSQKAGKRAGCPLEERGQVAFDPLDWKPLGGRG